MREANGGLKLPVDIASSLVGFMREIVQELDEAENQRSFSKEPLG